MNKLKRKQVISLTLTLCLLYSLGLFISVKAEWTPTDYYNVYFLSDAQDSDIGTDMPFSEVIEDSNVDFTWEVAFFIGDLVDDGGKPSEYAQFFRIRNDSVKAREQWYFLTGNHERYEAADAENWLKYVDPMGENESTSFVNNSNRTYQLENASQYCYEVKIGGNVVVLMMGVYLPTSNYAYPYFDWWKARVENNTDKIVITCTHQPLYRSGLSNYSHTGVDNFVDTSTQFQDYLATHPDACDLWLCGHFHFRTTETRIVYAHEVNDDDLNMNTTFMYIACVLGNNDNNRAHTYLFNFTNGSNILKVGEYNHEHDCWNYSGDNNPGNVTITLSRDFEFEPQADSNDIQFISINGQTNETTIYNATPTINWTRVENTSQYWLQIDNNVDFSSPEINITNINQYIYPAHYSENSTRVSFTLPNPIVNYDKYYCRVRACSR